MTGNAFSELRDAELIAKLGVQKANAVLSLDPKVKLDPAPGVDFGGLSPSLLKNLIGSDARIEFPFDGKQGSNDWTISGRLTSTGKPILANDPHRVMALPSLRYIVHLVAPGWDVIGAGEPGLPGVAVGHNQQHSVGIHHLRPRSAGSVYRRAESARSASVQDAEWMGADASGARKHRS